MMSSRRAGGLRLREILQRSNCSLPDRDLTRFDERAAALATT
jgi:hypothetical protein